MTSSGSIAISTLRRRPPSESATTGWHSSGALPTYPRPSSKVTATSNRPPLLMMPPARRPQLRPSRARRGDCGRHSGSNLERLTDADEIVIQVQGCLSASEKRVGLRKDQLEFL